MQLLLFEPQKTENQKYLNNYLCPLCTRPINRSDYLHSIMHDQPLVEYIANLVTHYRHEHRTSWNKCWGRSGGRYRSGWFGDYDKEKAKVNEAAKRQIIKGSYSVLISLGITPHHFSQLQNTTAETLAVAKKYL